MVKLTDLNPAFLGAGGEGIFNADMTPATKRQGVGLWFDCPCGCGNPVFVGFANPLDGGPPLADEHPTWQRTGDTFETLTLAPSIQRVGGCAWHGFIRNGEIVSA